MNLAELAAIFIADKERFKAELLAHPELGNQLLEMQDMVRAVESVSVDGFKVAYRLFYDRELPKVDEDVAREFADAFHNKKGVMYMAWRGKGKSTFLLAWCAYLIGVRPVGSTLLVRINDAKAKETGKAIAALIETNPGWKKLFPHVVPDKRKGWSVEGGFNVIDTRITGPLDGPEFEAKYSEWAQLCLADHHAEQSLLCAGVESGSVIGVHPSNGMWFDDLHDESNTRSQAEMRKVVDILEGNIIPTWFSAGGSPTIGVFCTPWSENDAYQAMLRTKIFKLVKLPIFTRDEEGELFEPLGYKVKLAWPEKFPMAEVVKMWEANPARFAQMYLVDLSQLNGLRLKLDWLHEFPISKIDATWPVYIGIDFASTADKLGSRDRDYFALAIARAIPGGGMVVTGGFRAKLSTGEAILKVQSIASMYPTLVIVGVEKYGKGEEFLNQLLFSTNLPILAFPFEKRPNLSKGQKFEMELAPMFTSGRMWIVDVEDDFLKNFKAEWSAWDGQKSLTRHDDTLDAVYGAAYVGQGNLMPRANQPALPTERKEKQRSPISALGAHRGYG